MGSRVINGYELYKKDAVIVEHCEDDHIIFNVKNNDNTDYYLVSMIYGYWSCDCADYRYRNQRNAGSFYCKHMLAAQFKLLDILKNQKDKEG